MPGDEQLVRIDGRRLRITNLDKVLYPETGTTKGEVIDYYLRVAPMLIPHVVGRPVTRLRWPEGVDHEPFFAKDLERGAPSWVKRHPIPHSSGSKDYPLVSDVATLAYLAQVASLELHVPQWRFDAEGDPGRPDRMVLDLDPGPGVGLAECAQVARWAREILQDMGLDPLPVTSGSKGIHLYAALPGEQTSDDISLVARELARAIEADHPDLVVSQMAKVERAGRVFIDWSQNNAAKTTIAPYSLRGRARPTAAAPRTWDELDDPELQHLLLGEVLERVERIGDPLDALGYHAGARASDDGPLTAYIAKRSAARTPEPVPANPLGATAAPGELPRFVIQEHHASRLHWDLRLERGGVLVSWAVPRGIPHSTTRNNLAVMTEDHPLEYAAFAGTIPRGEYGAGTMTIWDDGRYELEKWRDDEIIFTLDGSPGGPLGRVRLVLIRTDGEGEKSTWLLHRMKTDAAGRPQPDGTPVEASEQADASSAADGEPAEVEPSRNRNSTSGSHTPVGAAEVEPSRKRTSTSGSHTPVGAAEVEPSRNRNSTSGSHTPSPAAGAAATTEFADPGPASVSASASEVNERVNRKFITEIERDSTETSGPPGDPHSGDPHAAAPHAGYAPPTPAQLRPMLATHASAGIARERSRRWGDDAWAEVKWDGVRAIGIWDGRRLHLRARSGNDITAKYPELTRVDARLGPQPCVLDGEIVALDARGRPSFPRLQSRMNLSKPREIEREMPRTPVHWFLFDVLSHSGDDTARLALDERRHILEAVAMDAIDPIVVPPVFDDVDDALEASHRFGLEGVMVKNPAAPYRRGVRSEDWLKVKHSRTQEVVVGGIRPGHRGRAHEIGSLLVGIPDGDAIRYAGRVGSGFSDAALAKLRELLEPLRTDTDPFVGVPALDASDALWVRPEIVGEVEFAEFTPGGILRQARWRGLRPDKSPAEVQRED
ncbi:bifunctional non-homologous end joining protein LigD [Microbacterium terrae]|nr:non-homologous end-joining DNA ligase [Microbacterium terrae]MBP1077025.1 bifunctional non-homologous end joining protein LigD [Microbacterium terrae]